MARTAATPEQKEAQRRRLRRAAAAVYADKGSGGVTARAVAIEAGVSTGTLYTYFPSLLELMRSLWMEPVERTNETLEAIAAEHPEPLPRIRALLQAYVDFALANPQIHRGALLFVRPEPLPEAERQEPDALRFYGLLCAALREAQLEGAIARGEVDEQAQLLWAGIHGALALPVNADVYRVASIEALAPPMIETLLRGLGAEG